jgi:hypothetical protein
VSALTTESHETDELDGPTQAGPATPSQQVRELADGTAIVTADLVLPAGWNRTRTRVRFLLPVAFPSAQPDCFYADLDLRLADGNMPQNSGIQPLDGENLLWFSWHLSTWSPSSDTTATYLRFIERRLRDVR